MYNKNHYPLNLGGNDKDIYGDREPFKDEEFGLGRLNMNGSII